MNRRTRTFVVVGVAVAMAAVASFGVYRAIQNIPERTKYIPAHYLVVAKEDVPVGTILEAQHVRLAGWPQDTNVEGSFAKIEDVLGRGATAQIVANEPIIERKLAPKEAGGGLPPTIPAGMRAMSVKVNDVIGVAGFTVPGTRVDVVVVVREGANSSSISRAVLSNIQVLAAGTKFDQDTSKNGQPIKTAVVTLLVTPPDAEKLALAQTEGQLMLSLRNPLDVEAVQTQGVRMSGLLGAPAPPPVVKAVQGRPRVVQAPPPPAPKPEYTVDAIRGGTRTQQVVGKGGGL